MAEDENRDDQANASAGEPVDAEFETLDEASSGARPGNSGSRLRPAIITVIVVLVVAAGGYVLVRQTGWPGAGPDAERVRPAALAALSKRLDSLQTQSDSLRRNVSSRLDALETASAEQSRAADALKALQARLDALENAAPGASDGKALAALTARLDAVEQRLTSQTAGSAPADSAALEALRTRMSALEKAVKAAAAAQGQSAQRLKALEQRMSTVMARLDAQEKQGAHQDSRSALALALLGLDDAAQSGKPFMPQWRTLVQIMPQNTGLLALEPLARTGVASRAQLTQEFSSQISAIRAAANTPAAPSKTGLAARARAALGSLVSIRRIDGGGDGVDAVLARVQKALQRDDLKAAVKDMDGLDGAARQAAQGWMAEAQARLRLDRLLAQLKAQAGARAAQETTP